MGTRFLMATALAIIWGLTADSHSAAADRNIYGDALDSYVASGHGDDRARQVRDNWKSGHIDLRDMPTIGAALSWTATDPDPMLAHRACVALKAIDERSVCGDRRNRE